MPSIEGTFKKILALKNQIIYLAILTALVSLITVTLT